MQTELAQGSTPTPNKLPRRNSSVGENDSPAEGMIKVYRPNGSKIPSPQLSAAVTPAEKLLRKQGLFSSPMPTPTNCTREEALKNMRDELENRLNNERKAYQQVMQQLDRLNSNNGGKDKVALQALKDEAEVRGNRIQALGQQLAKTRSTIHELKQAQSAYHQSAQKVKDAETKLLRTQNASSKPPIKSTSRALSASTTAGTAKLRRELEEANSMMNMACKRVEQIEGITDQLIRQLSEAEAEIAELHAVREEESMAHNEEVSRLTREAMELADSLQEAMQKSAELEAQEEELKQQLAAAAHREEQLEAKVAAAAAAKTEAEARLIEDSKALADQIAVAHGREAELVSALNDKENALAEAKEKALQGTPIGNGAKQVLPMAMQRLRTTMDKLNEEGERKDALAAELETATTQAAAREASLKLKLEELDAERVRQLSEKDQSLDSMTRAVAMATKETILKQEAVNKLAAEVAALDAERSDLQSELQEATHRCLELESELNEVQEELSEACIEREQAQSAVVSLKEELYIATEKKSELSSALQANREQCTALESSIASMKAQLESTIAKAAEKEDGLRSAVAAAEANAANAKLQLIQAIDAQSAAAERCNEMEDKLRKQDGSVRELTLAVMAAQSRAADLNATLAATVDAAAAEKFEMLRASDAMQTQLGKTMEERDSLKNMLSERVALSEELENSVSALQQQLVATKAHHSAKVEEVMSAQNATESRLQTANAQLNAAVQSQDALVAVNKDLESAISTLKANLIAAEEKYASKMEQVQKTVEITESGLVAALKQLSVAATAQEQLSASVVGLQKRVSALSDEKSAVEESFKASEIENAAVTQQLRSQLQTAVEAQSTLRAERSSLESRLTDQEAHINHLAAALESRTAAAASKQQEIELLAQKHSDRAAALADQLERVCEERDTLDRECFRLRSSLDDLAEALQVKESEVESAKQQGTPKGEGAKKVLTMAFEKIRGLQQAVVDTKNALNAKISAISERDTTIASLQEAAKEREELHSALQKRMEAAAEAAQVEASELRKELAAAQEANEELEQVNAELAPQVEDLVAQLEAAAGVEEAANALKQTADAQLAESARKLQQALQERDSVASEKAVAEKEAGNLRAELAQLRFEFSAELIAAKKANEQEKAATAKVESTAANLRADIADLRFSASKKEAANKEVMLRTFDKIRKLEATLQATNLNISELEAQLECAEENAASLAVALAAKSASLAAVEKDNAALESAMCRLRVDVQNELLARQSAEKECNEAQKQISELENVISGHESEAAALQNSIVEQTDKIARAELALQNSTSNAEKVAEERDNAQKELSAAREALTATEGKAAAVAAELEAVKAEAAKKDAASKEVTRRAFEKIKSLEQSVKERDSKVSAAIAQVDDLSTELASAHGQLKQAQNEIARENQKNSALLEDIKVKDAALGALKEDRNAASKQVEELEKALKDAQTKYDELSAATESKASAIAKLKARVAELEKKHAASVAELSEYAASIASLQQEKQLLSTDVATATARNAEIEKQLVERSQLLEKLNEALALQKETVATAKKLGAKREEELARALCAVEERLGSLQKKSAEELQAARAQISMLKSANKSLAKDAAEVKELTQANEVLQKEADRAKILDKEIAELKKIACQYEALERANMELCAQMAQAEADRRAALQAAERAASQKTNQLRSHQLDIPEQGISRSRGKTWGALIACALAIVWSSAVLGKLGGDGLVPSTR